MIQTFISTVNLRLPLARESFYVFIYSLYQLTLQDEGRKLVDESGVYKNVLIQIISNPLHHEYLQSVSGSHDPRQFIFRLFDRNLTYPQITSDVVSGFLDQALDIASEFSKIYQRVYIDKALTMKDKNEELF